nr:tetratricopeptide repeat protein [uncultured Actinoplanes sp.]
MTFHAAQHLAALGRYEDAERAARAGLATAPHDAPLLALLASILRARRSYVPALAAADAAVAAGPHLPDGHLERAECLILLVRARDAVAAARAAVDLDPQAATGHLVLARALAAASEFTPARAAAARGLSLAPQSVEALLTVADVARDAGDHAAAVEAAQAALAIAPDNAYGRWLIAMLDAERLRVRRSMRGLSSLARDNPARPDVIAMTWPIRGLLSGLRRGLAVGGVVVCGLVVAGFYSRLVAAVLAAVLAGFALRVLVPAGALPWRCLGLLPAPMRRASIASLATVAVAVGALIAHAATGLWYPAVVALAAAPVMAALGVAEMRGAGRDVAGELRRRWPTTRKRPRAPKG